MTGSGSIPGNIEVLLNFGKNILTIPQFLLGTAALFQIPILLEDMLVMNVVSRGSLLRASRFIAIGIFALSAVVTPPDFVSQVSVAIPLVGLFFLTILVALIGRCGEG